MSDKTIQAARLLAKPGPLSHFMPTGQRATIFSNLAGEEGESFADMVIELEAKIRAMPKIYEQVKLKDQAVVHLHYSLGNIDIWITERDFDPDDPAALCEQHQAFGISCLGDPECADLGYISIAEIIDANVELDLHWTPITLGEVLKQLAERQG